VILKEKAARWNADREIQQIVKSINVQDPALSRLTARYSKSNAAKLLDASLDRVDLAAARLPYERLDQLTMELLMGVR
jgi:xylose isomerase